MASHTPEGILPSDHESEEAELALSDRQLAVVEEDAWTPFGPSSLLYILFPGQQLSSREQLAQRNLLILGRKVTVLGDGEDSEFITPGPLLSSRRAVHNIGGSAQIERKFRAPLRFILPKSVRVEEPPVVIE